MVESGAAMPDVELVAHLYRKHSTALRRVREDQRRLYAERGNTHLEPFVPYRLFGAVLDSLGTPAHYRRLLKPQLDDIEAEATYLLLRELKPQTVVEISPDGGWSTTWLLAALRDNGSGHLYSYDLFDHSTRAVPRELADGRWTFARGDVTRQLDRMPPQIDYLFLDSDHTAGFARWYIRELFPRLAPGTPVCIHDIFPERGGESRVIRDWLVERRIQYFTPAPAAAPDVHVRLLDLKRELGFDELIHSSCRNPMVFFRLP